MCTGAPRDWSRAPPWEKTGLDEVGDVEEAGAWEDEKVGMEAPIGLIVKGGTALFLQGDDPGAVSALSIVSRYRIEDFAAISEHGLKEVPRPSELSTLSWKYGFFTMGINMRMRLEPGPFDPELTELVRTLDWEIQKPTPKAPGK
jgi:hypothetical protein